MFESKRKKLARLRNELLESEKRLAIYTAAVVGGNAVGGFLGAPPALMAARETALIIKLKREIAQLEK